MAPTLLRGVRLGVDLFSPTLKPRRVLPGVVEPGTRQRLPSQDRPDHVHPGPLVEAFDQTLFATVAQDVAEALHLSRLLVADQDGVEMSRADDALPSDQPVDLPARLDLTPEGNVLHWKSSMSAWHLLGQTVRYNVVSMMLLTEVQRQEAEVGTLRDLADRQRAELDQQKQLLAEQGERLQKLEAILARQAEVPKP